eukprot:6782185-Prymnesium_polylepis.1
MAAAEAVAALVAATTTCRRPRAHQSRPRARRSCRRGRPADGWAALWLWLVRPALRPRSGARWPVRRGK